MRTPDCYSTFKIFSSRQLYGREEINSDQIGPRWLIDLDWYKLNNRSFSTLARNCLCIRCREQLGVEEGEIAATDFLAAIKDCCGKKPGFFSDKSPILESVFRLFLANGNQPLALEELDKQLNQRRGGNPYRTSVQVLSRLLESDQYYGLRQAAG